MSDSTHAHDDMWRTPTAVSSKTSDEEGETSKFARVVEEQSVEDSWYQVLRRKHDEHDDED
jgi:hypothetical protein